MRHLFTASLIVCAGALAAMTLAGAQGYPWARTASDLCA